MSECRFLLRCIVRQLLSLTIFASIHPQPLFHFFSPCVRRWYHIVPVVIYFSFVVNSISLYACLGSYIQLIPLAYLIEFPFDIFPLTVAMLEDSARTRFSSPLYPGVIVISFWALYCRLRADTCSILPGSCVTKRIRVRARKIIKISIRRRALVYSIRWTWGTGRPLLASRSGILQVTMTVIRGDMIAACMTLRDAHELGPRRHWDYPGMFWREFMSPDLRNKVTCASGKNVCPLQCIFNYPM